MSNQEIEQLIKTVSGAKKGNQFDKYISQARFPNFKNFEPNSVINFTFPLTVLVGANGTGKSSILHALWGMPFGYSTSRFWFSTEIDPIKEGKGLGNVRYIYTFYAQDINEYLSVRKIRTKQKLGYFEPTKPAITDGMEEMPPFCERHGPYRTDRWSPVNRDVIYINSKCEVGVFERYFYQTERGKLNEKLERFSYESSRLKKVIDAEATSSRPGGHEFVYANALVEPHVLEHINKILGQQYVEARYLLHRFYDRSKAPSVIFKSPNRTYSDSFAGSGELSVVTTVLKILEAKQNDLILIDEPETSLHPQAQINLICFLLEQINLKKLQVVISTHSPSIVEVLPKTALKVLELNSSGRAIILEDVDRSIAFHRIGHIHYEKITLITEDQLLYEFLKFCIRQLDEGIQNKFDLKMDSVGVDEVFTHHVPSWMNSEHNVFFIGDGDQEKYIAKLPDVTNLTEEEKHSLKVSLKKVGCSPAGLSQPEQYVAYVNWLRTKVKLIDAECPEYIFLKLFGEHVVNSVHPPTNKEYKKKLSVILKESGHDHDISAKSINTIFRTMLIAEKANGHQNPHVAYMVAVLMEIIESNGQ